MRPETAHWRTEKVKLQAIIFNVDGTLWNTTDYVADAWNRAGIPFVFARYGFGEVENPEISVDNLSELPKIVENLANPNCDNE